MFRHTLLVATAVIVPLFNVAMANQDELFSEVDSTSVFRSSETSSANVSPRLRRRIVSGEQLRDLLNQAGFDAKAISGRASSARKKLAPWTFPVLVVISEDESRVRIVLGLSTIKDVNKELTTARLLSLMKLSENGPQYSYHSGRQRTEISSTLTNRGLTADQLRDEINRLALAASKSSANWANQEQLAQNKTPDTAESNNADSQLSGKWTASRSATEAFAVEFLSDGKFNLVFVTQNSQTRSTGTFLLSGQQLQLNGEDGFRLIGQYSRTTSTSFTFQPANGKTLTFRKAE